MACRRGLMRLRRLWVQHWAVAFQGLLCLVGVGHRAMPPKIPGARAEPPRPPVMGAAYLKKWSAWPPNRAAGFLRAG
jgi:hypothetical protein